MFYQKLVQAARRNIIVHFWISYIMVLMIPILVIVFGVVGTFYMVNQEIYESNQNKMEHSIQLIENELKVLEAAAVQVTEISSIKSSAFYDYIDGIRMLQFKKGIDTLMNLFQYQGVRLMDKFYLYYNRLGYLVYEGSLYREKLFLETYLSEWKLEETEWREKIVNADLVMAKYQNSSSDYLHFIMPIRARENNNGVMVFVLNREKIIEYFSFAEEYGKYAIYIFDRDRQILLSNDFAENRTLDLSQGDFNKVFSDIDQEQLLLSVSKDKGWTYCLILPEGAAAHRLSVLRTCSIACLIITMLIGCMISLWLAVREGKPINQIFSVIEQEEAEERNTKKLGNLVTGIVHSNQEMQKEMEEKQPFLKKAFFHDLITLDVTNTEELSYLAENAGLYFKTNQFRLVSVRLFANNDFYEIDEQTLQEVRVIMQTIQKYLEAQIEGTVWFYQSNYLSMLCILEETSSILPIITETHQWLLQNYSTESDWGISKTCQNILQLWKYCEEAETARNHCKADIHIREYQTEFEDKQSYYFPEAAEERIYHCLCSGDSAAVYDSLVILETENFEKRHLDRKNMIKLNARLVYILELFEEKEKGVTEYITKLNKMILEKSYSEENYRKLLQEAYTYLGQKLYQEKKNNRSQLLEKIKNYIKENYMDSSLGLARVSMEFQISEGYVSTLFKKQGNMNFADYVEQIRMNRACELLKEKKHNIEEIASLVGYNSVQSFRRAFKRVYGINPREYH
ncbi:MAG: helix-turn-helix domain-containing protein [Lachnospiraceae bacterium]|nr:helix-turn-helix domain-containing protein [Lachnospiraceae bacterium]